MKIIVDAMGGDNAPVSNVRGALAAVRELGVEVILVGRGEDILKVLKEDGIGELPPGLEIVHATEVVEMCDNPATAFKEKKDSSLTVGLNLLKNGDGAAFVSAGSTGALLSAATLMVKRIRGIRRAAMAPQTPAPAPEGETLRFGRLVIQKGEATATKDGADLELTPREFDLLAYLAAHAGRVFSRQELMERVWNYEGYVGDVRAVDVAIRRLREKVEDDPAQPKYIITRRGAGYYFQQEP